LLKKVVFLDRDGVINQDSPNYIKSWSEFEFIAGSISGIHHLTLNGFAPIIITNQSAIGRRMMSIQDLEHIHTLMKSTLASGGGRIKDIFFCPHTPDDGCECRKPAPGLIFQAQKRYGINLADTVMVGDSAKDVECARNAGCGSAVLVRTGNGMIAEKMLAEKNIPPDHIANNLYDAAMWITYRH